MEAIPSARRGACGDGRQPYGRWSSSRRDDALASAARIAVSGRDAPESLHLDSRQGPRAVRAWRIASCRWIAEVGADPRRRRRREGEVWRRRPRLIPDYLALVGDAADGYPGLSGYGRRARQRCSTSTARSRTSRPGFSPTGARDALLFKKLATLVADAPVLRNVDELPNGAERRRHSRRSQKESTHASLRAQNACGPLSSFRSIRKPRGAAARRFELLDDVPFDLLHRNDDHLRDPVHRLDRERLPCCDSTPKRMTCPW